MLLCDIFLFLPLRIRFNLKPTIPMNKKLISLIFFLLCVFTTAFPQSILWRVSGKNIQSPSYLYGTIHIQDERVFRYDSTVSNAFKSCDAFAAEILLDELNVAGLRQTMMLPKGQVLSELLSKDDFAKLDSLCKAKLGVSAIFMNSMKPFFIASALQQADLPKGAENALDLDLLQKARAEGKSCYGVEQYMEQIKALDAISLKEQLAMLTEFIRDTANQNSKEMEELVDAYLRFDLDRMWEASLDTSLPKKFSKILLFDRNVTMAKRFVEIAKKQTLFCAVGCAHLAGEKGVIALLRKKGYSVEPVVFSWLAKDEKQAQAEVVSESDIAVVEEQLDMVDTAIAVPVESTLPMATGYDWITYRGKADIIDTGGTRTCNFYMVNRTDSILYLNIHAYGVEVMRAVFTPDSIKFVNKLTSQYYLGTYQPLGKFFTYPIDFQTVQAVFNGDTDRLPKGRKLSFEYSAFMPVDGSSSFFTEFVFKELNRVIEIQGRIKVVRLNVPGATNIKIPEKFERIVF